MNTRFTRRRFVTRAALAPLGAAVGLQVIGKSHEARAQTPIERVSGPRLKISLNAYSFAQALNNPDKGPGKGMTLLDLVDYCAEQNFDGVDTTGYYFPGYPNVPSDEFVNDLKRRAFVNGLEISGTGVRNNFANPDGAKRAADIELVKQWVEVAAKLGAPVIRVFAGAQPEGQSWEQISQWLVESVKPCVEHGRKHGVLIGIQNHGDSLKTADQTLEIVKRVNSPWFGVIVDTGYFTGDVYDQIAKVAPFAVNWQIKEKIDGKNGKTRIDLPVLARIIRKSGYRGYLPIETLAADGETYDPRIKVANFLKEVREAFA